MLFADLKGSLALLADRDPEEARHLLDLVLERMMAAVHRYEGTVNQITGDGIMALFGAPIAHEDHAVRSCYAALAMQVAVKQYAAEVQRTHGVPLQIRVGLNAGEVVVRAIGNDLHMDYSAIGQTTHVAARMEQMAMPGSILMTQAVLSLTEGYVQVSPLGPVPVKGLDAPVAVFELVGASGMQRRLQVTAARGLTCFVGRDTELAALVQAGAGHGQVVAVVGEAGVGKSRLVEVLREHLGREPAMWLTFRCSPYHTNSALYPVIAHLQRALQFQRDEPAAARIDRLESALQATRLPLEEAVPLMAALLSVPLAARYSPLDWSPQKHKQKTQEALVAWLVVEAERQPVLAVWEDLHWADPSTLELLGLVLDQTPTASLCTLLTCRPEFSPPWTLRSYSTQLTLTCLTHPQVEEMVQRITGGEALPVEVGQQIVAKTDGVPLFVEELTKMVLESGLLQEREEGYELTGPLAPAGHSHHAPGCPHGAAGSAHRGQGGGATGGGPGADVCV